MNFFENLKVKEKMVEATDYIDWIYEFTKKHNSVYLMTLGMNTMELQKPIKKTLRI